MRLKNIEFLRQFREEEIELPCEDRQYRNIHFMHFSRNRKEKHLLEKFLEKRITHSGLIGELVGKMEREDQVVQRRLIEYMQKLLKTFAGYMRKEPYASSYLGRLSAEVRRFLNAAEVYQGETLFPLLSTMHVLLTENKKSRKGCMYSRDITDAQIVTLQYLDMLYDAHDIFADLLQEETGKTGKVLVTSPVEECLFKLILLIKDQLFAMEATVNRLAEWKRRSRKVEVQEIYN